MSSGVVTYANSGVSYSGSRSMSLTVQFLNAQMLFSHVSLNAPGS
jgi:hypothetical protein